jgi:hypothetical protein
MNEDFQHDLDRKESCTLISFGRKQTQEGRYSNLFFFAYIGMVDTDMAIDPGITIRMVWPVHLAPGVRKQRDSSTHKSSGGGNHRHRPPVHTQ